jgi:lysine biosynthesis protein LysW
MAKCPECGTKLNVATDVKRGDQIVCNSCGTPLGVLNVRPLELEAISEIERPDQFDDLDWDDDDETEEEDPDIEDLALDDENWD